MHIISIHFDYMESIKSVCYSCKVIFTNFNKLIYRSTIKCSKKIILYSKSKCCSLGEDTLYHSYKKEAEPLL